VFISLLFIRAQLPTFTLAFNICTILYFFGSFSFRFIPSDNTVIAPPASLPAPPAFAAGAEAAIGAKFMQGAFIGVGQIFFASHYLSSVFIMLGMLLCSRPLALAALASSLCGACMGLAVGADLRYEYCRKR
jgi:urea transporter